MNDQIEEIKDEWKKVIQDRDERWEETLKTLLDKEEERKRLNKMVAETWEERMVIFEGITNGV